MIQADDATQNGENTSSSTTVAEPQLESTESQPQTVAAGSVQPAVTDQEVSSGVVEEGSPPEIPQVASEEPAESSYTPGIFSHRPPETLEGRLEEHLDDLRQIMMVKEMLAISGADRKLHRSYRNMWVADSNRLFQVLASLKRRLREIQKTST